MKNRLTIFIDMDGVLADFYSAADKLKENFPDEFGNNIKPDEVLDFSTRYLKIAAFILPAYPIFFLSNGFFMALKKSENAMLNNILRNVLVPIIVFYLAKYLSADFDSFFWLWASFQWTLSLLLFFFVIYFMKYRLNKSGTIIQP